MSTIFNPDANPESTSVDGYAGISGSPDWNTSWVATTGSVAEPSATTFSIAGRTTSGFEINRVFLLFDTSAIPATATIVSAVLSLYITAVADADTTSLVLISCNPATDTDLITADFNKANFGTTEFATRKTLATLSTSAYNDITLNASGIAAISLNGITYLGIRISTDYDNSAPTGNNVVVGQTAEGANPPKLTVTYSVAFTADVSDSITLTEAKTATRGALKTVTDSISLSEVMTSLRALVKTVTDSISLTESLTALYTDTWVSVAKATSTFTGLVKNASTWVNGSKNSTTFTNNSRHIP